MVPGQNDMGSGGMALEQIAKMMVIILDMMMMMIILDMMMMMIKVLVVVMLMVANVSIKDIANVIVVVCKEL